MALTSDQFDKLKIQLASNKSNIPVVKTGLLKETGSDITKAYTGIGEQLYKGGEQIVSTAQDKNLNLFEKAVQGTSQAFRAGSRAFGEGILGIGKAVLPQSTEESISSATKDVATGVTETDFVKNLINRYQSLDPETKRNIDNALGFAEGLADIGTGGIVSRTGKVVSEGVETGIGKIKSLFPDKTILKTTDDVVSQAENVLKTELPPLPKDATPAQVRARAELEQPIVKFKEKYAGLTPDIKKQIQGKPQKMAEYIDTVSARNLDPNVPTAYELGGNQVRSAVGDMQKLLDETGGEIGQTRQKLGTYRANIDQVDTIENSFVNELSKLNLQLADGSIVQIPGTVRKVSGVGDLKIINDLYSQLKIVKQDPSVVNLIDLRNIFDSTINFAKRVGEVSDSVDPLSRQVRKTIADTNATIVGKSEAQKLTDYSNFMEAFNDLKSYTDKNAGGEYLLRLVLSGRGGEARKIIQTVQKYTGKNLLDDAVMMTLVTDMLGNKAQKNLFAQEITKAGIDAARILKGDPSAIFDKIIQFAADKYIDAEKVLKEASQ